MARGGSTEGTGPGIPLIAEDRKGSRIDLLPIRKLLDIIVARWNPEEVWLFGSRARGTATEHSDWDLLVIVGNETPESERDDHAVWEATRGNGVGDVVVVTRAEFEEDKDVTNTLQYETAHFGVRLYER